MDRLNIFVPAIMSVGLLFWIVTLVRDLFRWRGDRALQRRSRSAGRATAAFALGELGPPTPALPGLRLRVSYVLTGIVCGAVAVYIFVGSTANYLREGGYVVDIAWLMASSLLVAGLFGFVAGVAFVVAYSWPSPPPALHAILRATPLTGADADEAGTGPGWGLSTAANLMPVVAVIFTLLVARQPRALVRVDDAVWSWAAEQGWLGHLSTIDPWTLWPVLLLAALLVAGAALRCHVLGAASVGGAGGGLLAVVVLSWIVRRPAPLGPGTTSYPARHVALVVALVGILSLAIAVLSGRRAMVGPLRAVGAAVVGAVVLAGLHDGSMWLTDALGGVLIGWSVALAVDAWVAHQEWHRRCRGCLWAPVTPRPPLLAPIHLPADRARLVRLVAHLAAAGAAVGLAVMAWTASVPSNPDGSLLDVKIQQPAQLALAAVVSVGALVSWRWPAVGAVVIAVAGAALGVFAALEYRPELAVLLTAALLVPAFLLWLSWQHRRSRGELVALAVLTAALVGGTWFGAQEVYAHYFGATHPDSTAPDLRVDRVEWWWAGGLEARGVTVVVGLSGGSTAQVEMAPVGGGRVVESDRVEVGGDRIARMPVRGLAPDTHYDVRVLVDDVADTSRGSGEVTTPAEGPMSFRVALGSCTRNGSNGRVFDQVAEADPLLFLSLGDFHYSNLDSTDPADFRAAFERQLSTPAQSALFRQVPVAYVWDDHDYGPNDAGADSPTRTAARTAYRQVVPSYGVEPGDAPIQQAFTIGRVRFVLTDNRSERTESSMLGAEQERWLVDELTAASRDHAVVVWGNPSPWVVAADPASDSWGAWPEERTRIADALTAAGVDNLVMLSGDAHMVALDDGTNTDFSTDRTGGFPLLHGAALDRPGSVKGGPYSGGAFPGGGQFATMDVVDEGGPVTVTLSGWSWQGRRLVTEEFRFEP